VYQWDFGSLLAYRHLFLIGIAYTLTYTVLCVLLGLMIGVLAAFASLSPRAWLRGIVRMYVELFRCTPVLVQLIWFYYALPIVSGIEMSPSSAAIVTLALYGGAFYSEIVRGGIVSIDIGQKHAARALGMSPAQVMTSVVLPQALKRMLPALVNQSIIQLKNTSLLSILAVPDLLYQGQTVAHETYRPLEAYSLVALVYFVVLWPATLFAKRLELYLALSTAA
jgi:polar amino acid transport system permease protein